MKKIKIKKEAEKEKTNLKIFYFVFLFALFISLGYSVLRYIIIKGVEIENMPLYISNKAIALASVILIGISFLLGPLTRFWPKIFASKIYLRKYFGLSGFFLASVHIIISLILFNAAYYPKFFAESGKLNLTGELSMLFGVIAFFIFIMVSISSISSIVNSMDKNKWLRIQRLGYLAFALVGLHVFVMGVEGWFKPNTWPGGLLPISLIAFIIIMLVLCIRLIVIIFPKKGAQR